MKRVGWILFVARRYFRSKRRNRGLAPSVLSVAGIAIGVITLIAVLGVMNGFQLGFINDILAIKSYHLRITTDGAPLTAADVARLRHVAGVSAVVPFADVQTMITGGFTGFQPAVVRGVPPDSARLDPQLVRYLHIIAGSLTLSGDRSIVIGDQLAATLGVRLGDPVSVVSLGGPTFDLLSPASLSFTVSGIFKSGYYDFDQTLCFVNLKAVRALGSPVDRRVYGVKLVDRFQDRVAADRIRAAFPGRSLSIVSWRQYNSAFFSALRMEKLVMTFLLGLIFLVVAVNIHHFLKRAVYERQEEIGILRSMGASPAAMRAVFVLDGLYIGVLGGVIGLLLGLLVSDHINAIFTLVESLVNVVGGALAWLLTPLSPAGGSFALFSPAYFYLDRVPSRVLFHEALFIFLFAILSSVAAAYLASRRVSEIKPAEVLRYE